jgi:hypothetical protein
MHLLLAVSYVDSYEVRLGVRESTAVTHTGWQHTDTQVRSTCASNLHKLLFYTITYRGDA